MTIQIKTRLPHYPKIEIQSFLPLDGSIGAVVGVGVAAGVGVGPGAGVDAVAGAGAGQFFFICLFVCLFVCLLIYLGSGTSQENPASSCVLLLEKYKSIPSGKY